MHYANFAPNAVFPAAKVGEEAVDSIITGGGIIIKLAESGPGGSGNLILNLFTAHYIGTIAAGDSSKLVRVQ